MDRSKRPGPWVRKLGTAFDRYGRNGLTLAVSCIGVGLGRGQERLRWRGS